MNLKLVFVGFGLGCLGAATADLSAYRKALLERPDARFDWTLALWRWVQGGVIGAVTGGAAA